MKQSTVISYYRRALQLRTKLVAQERQKLDAKFAEYDNLPWYKKFISFNPRREFLVDFSLAFNKLTVRELLEEIHLMENVSDYLPEETKYKDVIRFVESKEPQHGNR